MQHADDPFRGQDEVPFRNHLGASMIGRQCDRELWYSFVWAKVVSFQGRILRLFQRGHLEEVRFVALLRMINCTVWQHDANGKQFRIHGANGHYGGSLDGVVQGIPECPNEPVLAEFKTHSANSFAKLESLGVALAKPEHFVQMQCYGRAYNLKTALYMAVNKDNDDLYAELITIDPRIGADFESRALAITSARVPPPRCSEEPGYYGCRYCDYSSLCHKGGQYFRSCRTCKSGNPAEDGSWVCSNDAAIAEAECAGWQDVLELTPVEQYMACNRYERV